MRIHITGIHAQAKESTAQIAQLMVTDIARTLGINEMGIYSYNERGESEDSLRSRFDGIIAGMEPGDIVIFQSPTWHDMSYDRKLLDHMKRYGARIIVFIHDMKSLMFVENRWLLEEIISFYNEAEVLIVPSENMKKYLLENGVKPEMKFVNQEIWDYTLAGNPETNPQFEKIIHFAGNPNKFQFPNMWNYEVPLKLYTAQACSGQNVKMAGWMSQAKLIQEVGQGGFGLVWYGDDNWKEYMRYNCSFKLSTCLAAGIPVIVPKGIANEQLIKTNHLGIVVNQIDEAIEIIQNMELTEYRNYLQHVGEFAFLLRGGYFTRKLLVDSIHALLRQE